MGIRTWSSNKGGDSDAQAADVDPANTAEEASPWFEGVVGAIQEQRAMMLGWG